MKSVEVFSISARDESSIRFNRIYFYKSGELYFVVLLNKVKSFEPYVEPHKFDNFQEAKAFFDSVSVGYKEL